MHPFRRVYSRTRIGSIPLLASAMACVNPAIQHPTTEQPGPRQALRSSAPASLVTARSSRVTGGSAERLTDKGGAVPGAVPIGELVSNNPIIDAERYAMPSIAQLFSPEDVFRRAIKGYWIDQIQLKPNNYVLTITLDTGPIFEAIDFRSRAYVASFGAVYSFNRRVRWSNLSIVRRRLATTALPESDPRLVDQCRWLYLLANQKTPPSVCASLSMDYDLHATQEHCDFHFNNWKPECAFVGDYADTVAGRIEPFIVFSPSVSSSEPVAMDVTGATVISGSIVPSVMPLAAPLPLATIKLPIGDLVSYFGSNPNIARPTFFAPDDNTVLIRYSIEAR